MTEFGRFTPHCFNLLGNEGVASQFRDVELLKPRLRLVLYYCL